jgi:hypothetical protein
MPATIEAGDLLLIFADVAGNGATPDVTDWDGFTEIHEYNYYSGPYICKHYVAYKKAVGNEDNGSITISGSNLDSVGAITASWSDAKDPTVIAPEVNGEASGNSTAPDSGSLSPTWGDSGINRWVSSVSIYGHTVTVTSYALSEFQVQDTYIAMSSIYSDVSSYNPGAYTLSASSPWGAVTTCIPSSDATVAGEVVKDIIGCGFIPFPR